MPRFSEDPRPPKLDVSTLVLPLTQNHRPPVPYGTQNESTSLVSEQGFKQVRGELTEGRYLVFEQNGFALSSQNGTLSAAKAVSSHSAIAQRFVVHEIAGGFTLTSAADKSNIVSYDGKNTYQTDTFPFAIHYLGGGTGYSIEADAGKYLRIGNKGSLVVGDEPAGFEVFSVTYYH